VRPGCVRGKAPLLARHGSACPHPYRPAHALPALRTYSPRGRGRVRARCHAPPPMWSLRWRARPRPHTYLRALRSQLRLDVGHRRV
jgi:hypothetical protein